MAAVALLLGTCAAPPPAGDDGQPAARLPTDAEVEQYNAQVDPDERIICRDEVPVGSNIPRRTCRYVRDIEETSRFTREQLRQILQ